MSVIKNYTTNVNFMQTVAEIEKMLTEIGARKIGKEYNNEGVVIGLVFDIEIDEHRIPIKLPARIERIHHALRQLYNNENDSGRRARLKAAMKRPENIGWRILKDWLAANIAIMQLDQINMMEALLPFSIVKDGKTLYELFESNNLNFGNMAQHLLEYK